MNNIKRSFILAFVLFMLCSCHLVCAQEAPTNSSLTICYSFEKQACEGLTIQTYQIAYRTENGTYELTDRFAKYPVSIYAITSQNEWKVIGSTLAGYAVADQLKPDYITVTDQTGTVQLNNVNDGLYLTMAVAYQKGKTTVTFDDFITVLPQQNADGSENHHVRALPKYASFAPPETEYKVVKQWKDYGNADQRPESITVDIYKNQSLFTTCVLSDENQWCYRWYSDSLTDRYRVVERTVDSKYKVTVEQNGTTFLLTNSHPNSSPTVPQTGDQSMLSEASVLMALLGIICWLMGLAQKRSNQ